MAAPYLSKFKIGTTTYELKDPAARSSISGILTSLGTAAYKAADAEVNGDATGVATTAAVKSYVDSAVGKINQFEYTVVDALPEASADTMYRIYLVAIENASSPDAYAEYITIRNGSEDDGYTYVFEKIGDTNLGLDGYVPTARTIAGLALSGDISADALKEALGLGALAYKDSAEGTVAEKVVSGVKASGTSTGSITVTLKDTDANVTSTGNLTSANVTLAMDSYTPAGSVTVTAKAAAEGDTANYTPAGTVSLPKVKVSASQNTDTVKVLDNAGTDYSLTAGKVEKAADATSAFAVAGLVATVGSGDDEETLIFSAADTADAVTAAGAVTYTAPTLSGSLPTFKDATVMTGLADVTTSYVTGDDETATTEATFSGVASVISAGFGGTAATLTGSGTVADTSVSVKGSVKEYEVDTADFNGAKIELDVGDITVPSQTITVE